MPNVCAINQCGDKTGAGTHMSVFLDEKNEILLKICERHWQAIRTVNYVATKTYFSNGDLRGGQKW